MLLHCSIHQSPRSVQTFQISNSFAVVSNHLRVLAYFWMTILSWLFHCWKQTVCPSISFFPTVPVAVMISHTYTLKHASIQLKQIHQAETQENNEIYTICLMSRRRLYICLVGNISPTKVQSSKWKCYKIEMIHTKARGCLFGGGYSEMEDSLEYMSIILWDFVDGIVLIGFDFGQY